MESSRPAAPPAPEDVPGAGPHPGQAITKKCTVRLEHLDLDVKHILKMDDLLENNLASVKETAKRDNENIHDDGPLTKKQKSDDIVVIESDTKPLERVLKPPTPDVTVTKLRSPPPKELGSTLAASSRFGAPALSPSENRPKVALGEKSTLQRTPSFESAKKSDNTQKPTKMSTSSSSSSSSSSASGSNNHDRTDRTSLQCLEQKLLDLKQKAQAKSDKAAEKAAAELHSSKPKSLSPSGLKPSKELFHRRKEDFITERKKTSLSPMKKPIKKSMSLPPGKDKMGNLFCPTTDAKVTILPCNKPNGKEVDVKLPSAANSVTITKLSSGDSLNVPPKDIKKMFNSKSEMKTKVPSVHSKLSGKGPVRTEKRSGEKGDKVHRDHKSRERNREEGKVRHIGCSKCREQFSTKEARKLHTCNSILDAHYLIDGGDRQKTSPTSSVTTSESNSASLSRSSSRSSSPGLPQATPPTKKSGETAKLKISMKGDKLDKPKVRKDDSDKMKVKRDSMKEKWVESKPSQKSDLHGDDQVTKDERTRITIDTMKPGEGDAKGPSAPVEIMRMEAGKDEMAHGAPGDRMDHAFAFTGKRTYSPSMSETASVEGKESPRETNSKDSPASQADSGVFSIASSASPSKVDGVLNSDVRSPDSPSSRERTGCSVADVNQWTKSTHGLATPATASSEAGAPQPPLPQGIQIPHSLSITRVMSQAQPTFPSNPASGPGMVGSKNMGILANAPWVAQGGPNISPNFYTAAMIEDANKKKRGRPRKNDFEMRMARMKGGKGGKEEDDDKDLYDFGAEEDESKPMQPLRPRRPGAPTSYKDPDSDEDAKQRPPELPLIQSTQAFRQVHDLALNQVDGIGHNLNPAENSIDPNENLNDAEKDEKNVSYTSRIEENAKGGIKLKIKIKKSASPAPLDAPEPPVKKTKLEEEEEEAQAAVFPKQEPSILSTMSEMQRLANGLSRSPGAAPMDAARSPGTKPGMHPHLLSPHTAPWLKPGMPGGGEPAGATQPGGGGGPPQPAVGQAPMPRIGSNNNPVSQAGPAEDPARQGEHPKGQHPYSMQTNLQNNFPGHGPGQPAPHSNPNYEAAQQNFGQGSGFGDYNNYSGGYGQQQHQQWSLEQQQQMYHHRQQMQMQHMAAYRHGGPGIAMRPGFMPQRMMPGHPGMEMAGGPRMQGHPGMEMAGGPRMAGHPGMEMAGGPRMASHPGMEMAGGPRMAGHPGMEMAGGPRMAGHPGMELAGGPRMQGHPGMEMPGGPRMGAHPGMMGMMGPRGPQGMPGYPGMGQGGMVRPPSLSPALAAAPARSPQADWPGAFPAGQYRTASPQYSQAQAHFTNSPTYSSSHPYSGPPTPGTYQNPPSVGTQPPLTPGGSYPAPTTPVSYPSATTPGSFPITSPNPGTPVSYNNPTTPVSYPNPTTPVSYPNPTTPGSYANPSTPSSQQNPLTPQPQDVGSASKLQTSGGGVIQQNPLASPTFSSPKNEPLDPPKSSIPNLFKDGPKALTPMLSPPSTTSSLRKIRRPSKHGTVSPPNQKTLSPVQQARPELLEMVSPLQVKKEPETDSSPVAASNENNGTQGSDSQQAGPEEGQDGPSPKREKLEPAQPPAAAPPPQLPPPTVKTPEPPRDPRWGLDGEDGMPEKALKLIFSYVCTTQGCLPFLPYAMRTCKLWGRVAADPELWTHANLGTNVKEKLRTEKKLEWILKNKFPNAIDVDVQNWRAAMSAPALKIIAANCPNLTGLGMSSCVKLTYEDVRIIPSLFPNLERIDLSSVSPSTASSRSAASSTCLSDLITAIGVKLISFNISNNKMAGLPFVFKAISQHSKNLRCLDVSSITTTSRDTIMINIEKLAKGCPKLTKFRTTNTMLGLNETPIREQIASPAFPNLEELTIGVDQRGYFDGMDDNQVERILKKSAKLRILDIRGCKGITDSTLVRLPCWDIEYLQVAGSSICTSTRDGLELLMKKWWRTLLDLDIATTSDSRTVDWALLALVENEEEERGSLRLRKLNLNGTGVSMKTLTKLLAVCSTLESLNLTSCRALPRGMKRVYHDREDVEGLHKAIVEGKFDPKDAGSDDDC